MPAPSIETTDGPNLAETIARIAPKPIELVKSEHGEARLFAVPDGYTLETDEALRKLDHWPTRKTGTVVLRTVDSFVQYVNQHRNPETQLYVVVSPSDAATPLTATAVFNDHSFGGYTESMPGWRDFQAVLKPDSSPEWKAWIMANTKQMSQAAFATFIEDNQQYFAGAGTPGGEGFPSGGDMLKMALEFEATSEKRIRSTLRLQSGGIQMEYVDTDDAATVSRMQAFERFRVGLAPFWRGPSYPLEARLRYRQSSGALQLWYDLIRPDVVVDHAVEEILAKIEADTTIKPIFGAIAK